MTTSDGQLGPAAGCPCILTFPFSFARTQGLDKAVATCRAHGVDVDSLPTREAGFDAGADMRLGDEGDGDGDGGDDSDDDDDFDLDEMAAQAWEDATSPRPQ